MLALIRAHRGSHAMQAQGLAAAALVRNALRDKLARGEVVSSLIVRLSRGIEIAQIACAAGFDSLYVDLEHSSLSLDIAGQICLAAQALDVTPLIRVPTNRPEWICRALDAGALGVIAPHVESATEAREVVRLARFPPRGQRSMVGQLPQLQYRAFPPTEACVAVDRATMVVVQLEGAAAIEAVEDIMAVDGVDMAMIGANDLMADFGLAGDYAHPRLHDAFERSIAACAKFGKYAGIGGLGGQPELQAKFIAMGARYVSCGTDASMLLSAATAKVRQVKEMSGR